MVSIVGSAATKVDARVASIIAVMPNCLAIIPDFPHVVRAGLVVVLREFLHGGGRRVDAGQSQRREHLAAPLEILDGRWPDSGRAPRCRMCRRRSRPASARGRSRIRRAAGSESVFTKRVDRGGRQLDVLDPGARPAFQRFTDNRRRRRSAGASTASSCRRQAPRARPSAPADSRASLFWKSWGRF